MCYFIQYRRLNSEPQTVREKSYNFLIFFFILTVYSKSYSLNGQTCFNVSAILECFPHASKRKVIITHPELNFSNYTLRKKTYFSVEMWWLIYLIFYYRKVRYIEVSMLLGDFLVASDFWGRVQIRKLRVERGSQKKI